MTPPAAAPVTARCVVVQPVTVIVRIIAITAKTMATLRGKTFMVISLQGEKYLGHFLMVCESFAGSCGPVPSEALKQHSGKKNQKAHQ